MGSAIASVRKNETNIIPSPKAGTTPSSLLNLCFLSLVGNLWIKWPNKKAKSDSIKIAEIKNPMASEIE